MSKEELKTIKSHLISAVMGQMGDLKGVNTHELGEAIDMIKDMSEAIYYCTIAESMDKVEEQEKMRTVSNVNYYTTQMYPDHRDMERTGGYMYYPGGSGSNTMNGTSSSNSSTSNSGNGRSYYTQMRDPRQGRAAYRRRLYMEGKQQHKDAKSQLHELETYLQELSTDITEMVENASPEEKTTLKQKMKTLADKI